MEHIYTYIYVECACVHALKIMKIDFKERVRCGGGEGWCDVRSIKTNVLLVMKLVIGRRRDNE